MVSHLHLVVFAAVTFLAGVLFLPVMTRILDFDHAHRFLGALGRIVAAPFQLVARLFSRVGQHRTTEAISGSFSDRRFDPREQRLSDSALVIRNVLLVMATAIQRTQQTASNSSQALSEVREVLNGMGLPSDLALTASQLVAQIDRVVDSNSTLKVELASSQEILTTQQQLIETLRSAVSIDSMTQLASRSHFDEKLAESLKLKKRYDDPFFLLLLDVDNFKAINDNHGHQAGDRILKGVAFKLKNTLRESDFAARFGGDEFAVLLPKANRDSASRLAWKLRDNVRESRFLLDGKEIMVTLSIGGTEALIADTPKSLLKRADEALYKVKEGGRDGVKFAEQGSSPNGRENGR